MSVRENTRSQSMSIQEVSSSPGGLISTGPDEPPQWIPGASHSREALKRGQTGGRTKHQASHKSMLEYKTLPLAYEEILSESPRNHYEGLARMWEMLSYNQGPGKEADPPITLYGTGWSWRMESLQHTFGWFANFTLYDGMFLVPWTKMPLPFVSPSVLKVSWLAKQVGPSITSRENNDTTQWSSGMASIINSFM